MSFLLKHPALLKGALLILLSELCLVLSGIQIRQLATALPMEMIVFTRNALGLLLFLPWVLHRGVTVVKTDKFHFHLLRACVGVAAMYCLYYSWAYLPLAEAALLKQTAPFYIPVIAYLWLKEPAGWLTRIAIVVGFCGVYAVLNPGVGSINTGVLIGSCGAMLGALAKVCIRRMSVTEPSPRIVFYFSLLTSLISALPAYWRWQMPEFERLGQLLLMAALSTGAQLLLSRAYALAPAAQLGPFTFSSVAFAALFGWLWWGEQLADHTLLGMGLIGLAALISLIRGRLAS